MSRVEKVLVIDDSESDHLIAEWSFSDIDSSIVVDKAYDGQEGLEWIKAHDDIDAVLLDVNMPRMNAFEFMEAYKNLGIKEDIDIYILSSTNYPKEIEKIQANSDVRGFINKPLDIDKIMKHVLN